MAGTLSSSRMNSTTVRFLFQSLPRRAALRASAALAPRLAGLWAEQLFLTPPRAQHPESALLDLIDARSRFVLHKGRHIASWSWGTRDTPAVLLAHGWGGAATQMSRFVYPLVFAGYRVIAYDQPAHGLSEGRLTGLPDFADVLAEVASYHGGVESVIAHSLGAAAAAFALSRGLPLKRAVLVSPPADLLGYSRRFARWHWIPERVRGAMQAAIEERFGIRWAEFELARMAPRLAADALVIHDRSDRVVPSTQGEKFARHWIGARLLLTNGLGHGRILEDEAVVRAAADFIAGRSKVASLAAPALPRPARAY
jgi:pimeloyl-ACP methyl ester carboxylesterase